MPAMASDLAERMRMVVEAGYVSSLAAWATKAGLSNGAIRHYIMRAEAGTEASMRASNIRKLAQAARVSPRWLETGVGTLTDEPTAGLLRLALIYHYRGDRKFMAEKLGEELAEVDRWLDLDAHELVPITVIEWVTRTRNPWEDAVDTGGPHDGKRYLPAPVASTSVAQAGPAIPAPTVRHLRKRAASVLAAFADEDDRDFRRHASKLAQEVTRMLDELEFGPDDGPSQLDLGILRPEHEGATRMSDRETRIPPRRR